MQNLLYLRMEQAFTILALCVLMISTAIYLYQPKILKLRGKYVVQYIDSEGNYKYIRLF
jgi:hypothetical protein